MYTKLDGWEEDIQDCRRRCDLPFAAQAYLAAIEKYTGVPITMIGVGPERDQIIMP
jgi:adenylosuccinate synthase